VRLRPDETDEMDEIYCGMGQCYLFDRPRGMQRKNGWAGVSLALTLAVPKANLPRGIRCRRSGDASAAASPGARSWHFADAWLGCIGRRNSS
jgi:hypothetical protein